MILTQKDFTYQINNNNYTIIQGSNIISGLLNANNTNSAEEQVQTLIKIQILLNNSTYDLKDVKQAYINLSKILLEEYLANNPIKSRVHNGIEKCYSIKSEKQNYLSSEIIMAQMAQLNNMPYQPSWNATGESCSYNWTLEELMQLAFEISQAVKPLVLKQQEFEDIINNCTTAEELLDVNILY